MTVTDDELLSALREAIDPAESPVATPDDVAGSLPIGAEAVRQRLLRFAADGDVATRKVGRSRVFWVDVDDVDDDLTRGYGRAPDDRDVKDIVTADHCNSCGWEPAAVILTPDGWECYNCGDDPDRDPFDPVAAADELLQEENDNAEQEDVDVAAVLEDADLPGSGEKLAERKEAIRACYDRLREDGEVKTGTFKSEVYPEHPDGYTSGKSPANSWWKNAVYPGLLALSDADPSLKVADTSGVWRYEN